MAEYNQTVLKLVTAFILLVIGISFLTTIATSAQQNTTPSVLVTNEAVSIASARFASDSVNPAVNFTLAQTGPTWTDGLVASSIVVKNSSGSLITSGNYTWDANLHKLAFKNTTYFATGIGSTSNDTLVSYSAYPQGYLTQVWDATVVNLIPGFFSLGLLGVALWLFYSVGKDLGF